MPHAASAPLSRLPQSHPASGAVALHAQRCRAGHGPTVAEQGRDDAVGIGVGHFNPLFDGLVGRIVVAQGGGFAGHFVVYGVAQQVAEVAHMVGEVGVAPGVRALERPLLSGQMEHPRLFDFKACR